MNLRSTASASILTILTLCLGCTNSQEDVPTVDPCSGDNCDIIGEDGRVDWFRVREDWSAPAVGKTWRAISADSVVAITSPAMLKRLLKKRPFRQTDVGLCKDERFAEQAFASRCSGLLIADDLVLTAGHCVNPDKEAGELDNLRVMFNYRMVDKDQLAPIDATKDVYTIAQRVTWQDDDQRDYALIRLDRSAAPDHVPHPWVRWNAKADDDEYVIVIGHPNGLPVKFSGGVVFGTEDETFEHTADTLPGTSGAPVFDEQGYLIGVHTDGLPKADFERDPTRDCDVLTTSELPSEITSWLNELQGTDSVNSAHHAITTLGSFCAGASAPFCESMP